MRRLTLTSLALVCTLAACSNSTPATPTTTTTTGIDAFSGVWRPTTTTSVPNGCSAMNWTVTSTGTSTATIAYSATCDGVPISGNANGTLNGTTLAWTTTGGAANACGFGLSGTAVPDSSTGLSDLRVDYSGTVCGIPVAGTQLLQR